jgi:hypothetical protein
MPCLISHTILALRMALRIRSSNENGPEAFTLFCFYQIEKPNEVDCVAALQPLPA